MTLPPPPPPPPLPLPPAWEAPCRSQCAGVSAAGTPPMVQCRAPSGREPTWHEGWAARLFWPVSFGLKPVTTLRQPPASKAQPRRGPGVPPRAWSALERQVYYYDEPRRHDSEPTSTKTGRSPHRLYTDHC